ncbi:hypothetical protein HANVADRAFT_47874 [Hanseniaspora valbyensis NRRL Y-1626]|uniref:Transcription initiation factor TFIID subunit 1 histone acetyltransferase domain-containing protein n=1 Tax=Hanseniaspora valbyensis NRRL Y-1626 TaxID=766949 RepID=A0A1B7TGN7_9ASCO|nr:hypothetical protein HANVADRAFT_47874 [Hanseniaspora valbyensis NRRL Y-1626]
MAGISNKSSNAGSANKGNSKTNNDGSALTNEDEAYDAIMGGDFGSMNIMGIIDNNSKEKNGSVGKNDKDEGEVEHLPDAIDFEDEDELVSDFEEEDDDDNNNDEDDDDRKKTEDTANKNRDNQHSQENAADPKESDKRRAKAGGGYWKLKESETLPDDDQLRKIVTPEDLAIQDFIMSYEKFIDDNKLFNIDEKQSNLEEQLAPWNVSKNFLNSITMRTTIAISGEGDPTGLGEGFNYLRASTVSKNDFEMAEIYNKLTYQQQKQVAKPVNVSKSVYSDSDNDKSSKTTYEEELKKIWYRQQLSLSIQNPYKQLGNNANFANITHFKKNFLSSSKVPKGKVMKFVRKKRDANGIIHRETEFIKDPSLMHAYISHYEQMESNLDTEQLLKDDAKKYILGKTEQEKTDKLHAMLTKKLSEVSKRSMALSQAQVTKKINKQKKSETSPVKKSVKERKPSSRTCTACGQLGHIKTNKICPLFQQK